MGQLTHVWSGGSVTTTDTRTLAEAQSGALANLSDFADAKRAGGHMTALGIAVDTDAVSLVLLNGAYVRASAGGQTSFSFELPDGSFQTISAAQMIALFNDVAAFLQACFTTEQGFAGQITSAATNAAVDAIDYTQGWPS